MRPQRAAKYPPYPEVPIRNRQWPDGRITSPPIWCSVDLRDGNQALVDPMGVQQKRALFDTIVAIGFKEIEIGFPAASRADFDFCRALIEERRIPDDVTVQVLVQAREHLIERTFTALEGVPRAIVHLYNSTSTVQREVVFRTDKRGVRTIAVDGARRVRDCASAYPETDWVFQYSPESFTGTEVDYALEVCDAVNDVWQPAADRKVIINLPATVELSTPNLYADLIEWMHRRLAYREAVILSVHPHNDRGTAVAAAELALMAGAERVEGTLFGNGERTGNVDLMTLALNMYTQGVDPGLDFSDVPTLARCAEECTRLPVHPRHPYAGSLVFTAFAGSHQDAIRKGFAAQQPDGPWRIPYLAIDPQDIGRTYDAVVRVNSQSGKGGVAFVLERDYGIFLCPDRQVEFSRTIQDISDRTGCEVTAAEIWTAFREKYGDPFSGRWRFSAADSRLPHPPRDWIQHVDLQGVNVHVREAIVGADGAEVNVMVAARFDGCDYPVEGSPAVDLMAYTRLDERRICGTGKKDGRVMLTEVLTVAEDGSRLAMDLEFQGRDGWPSCTAVFVRD